MSSDSTGVAATQGFGPSCKERMPMLALEKMDEAQSAAAKALIEGPRKGVFGPFVPLLRTPDLLDRVGKLGEYLRFSSGLDGRLRELATCAVSRHLSNQFEWVMHAPLALKAGVGAATLEALRVGAQPKGLPKDEEVILDFTRELLTFHGVSDATYQAALELLGERQVVELATLLGYFAMVSWLMNVARTPAQANPDCEPLQAFPH